LIKKTSKKGRLLFAALDQNNLELIGPSGRDRAGIG
jgi:hypothetical protein